MRRCDRSWGPMPARRFKLPPALDKVRGVIHRFGHRRAQAVRDWLGRKSAVGNGEIIASDAFPWVAELEANWRVIRRELDAVMAMRADLPPIQDLSPIQYGINSDKTWKVFGLTAYGRAAPQNCARCPDTARLLQSIPDLEVAFFSVLEPGAHISAHSGIYKGMIRAHLGLIVPEPREQVRMRVGGEMVFWEEGRCVVFDDTYRHEVWNDTDGVRVVLLIDVPRPFPPVMAAINKAILAIARASPVAGAVHRRQRAWEEAFYGARQGQAS